MAAWTNNPLMDDEVYSLEGQLLRTLYVFYYSLLLWIDKFLLTVGVFFFLKKKKQTKTKRAEFIEESTMFSLFRVKRPKLTQETISY